MSHSPHPFLTPLLRGSAITAIAVLGSMACSGAAHDPIPVASLATTTPAQVALRGILDDWARSSRTERMATAYVIEINYGSTRSPLQVLEGTSDGARGTAIAAIK